MSAMPITIDPLHAEAQPDGFDFAARVDELRCHSTDALKRNLAFAGTQQQRWHLEALATLRALDDRDALGPVKDATVSARTAADNLNAARAFERLPKLAEATYDGAVSWDQARSLVQLATPDTDAEWARRGPNLQPIDIERKVRQARRVTLDDVAARREARMLSTWRDEENGMLHGRWSLPDVDGVLVENVLEQMAERLRPAKGMPWDSLVHRKADALVDLCANYADVKRSQRPIFEIVNISNPNATSFGAEVATIPLAQEQLAALIPEATIRDCVVDDTGLARTVGRPRRGRLTAESCGPEGDVAVAGSVRSARRRPGSKTRAPAQPAGAGAPEDQRTASRNRRVTRRPVHSSTRGERDTAPRDRDGPPP